MILWKKRVAFAALAALLAFVVGCTSFTPILELPPGETHVNVPVHEHAGVLFARVNVNGQDAGYFLIDTGADLNVVDDDLAERLELPSGPSAFSVGVGGRQKVSLSRVGEMRLGALVLGKHRVVVADLEVVSTVAGMNVAGLLGRPLFHCFPVTVDYRTAAMTFYHPNHFQPPVGARPIELTLRKGRPYVKALVNEKDEVWMLVDAGYSGHANFNHAFAKKHPELLSDRGGRIVEFAAVGGTSRNLPAELESFEILGRCLPQVKVWFSLPAQGAKADQEPKGVVGAGILKNFRLTFDYRQKRLWVEWLPPNSAPALPVEATAD